MYNISAHYENIFNLAKLHTQNPLVVYLHPFGSTNIEHIEWQGARHLRGPLILCYDQEPLIPGFNDVLFDYIHQHVLTNPNKRVILINTERNSEAKQYFLNKYNFIDVESFFHIFAAHDWYRGSNYLSIPPIKDRIIHKKFISFNRLTGDARCYRSIFVSELIKHNLLEFGHVSYSTICPNNKLSYKENLEYAKYYNVPDSYLETVVSLLDSISQPLRIDSADEFIPNGSMHLGLNDQNIESFLHVVSETCFWDKKQHLTEKIFKPILLKQPFVLLGGATNLSYLKSYGFKTFEKWWDESYDNIEDPIERIKAVVSVIEQITKKSNIELQSMLVDMEEILEYNYNLFNSKDFIDAAWQELSNNLIQVLKRNDI